MCQHFIQVTDLGEFYLKGTIYFTVYKHKSLLLLSQYFQYVTGIKVVFCKMLIFRENIM